jgi:hypothetical protein
MKVGEVWDSVHEKMNKTRLRIYPCYAIVPTLNNFLSSWKARLKLVLSVLRMEFKYILLTGAVSCYRGESVHALIAAESVKDTNV